MLSDETFIYNNGNNKSKNNKPRKSKTIKNIPDCCKVDEKVNKKCVRKSDLKLFNLPRRFSKKACSKNIKGFSMRSSCAPYKDC